MLSQLPTILTRARRVANRLQNRPPKKLHTRELHQVTHTSELPNRLIQGDNLHSLAALLPEFRGQIDLIYLDPPFASQADYHARVTLPNSETLHQPAYSDTWENGLSAYLKDLTPRLFLLRELLSDRGSLYLHIDWHAGHYLKIILDEIFGPQNFINEIIWSYKTGGTPAAVGFSRKHDTLLFYSKTSNPIFNPLTQKSYVKTLPEPHTASGISLGVARDETCELCEGGIPGQKYRLVRMRDVWDDISTLFRNDAQRLDYPTQKPEALLDRIIRSSSHEGSLVLDPYAGSGTTPAVAERLHRRWIALDSSPRAITLTRARLQEIQHYPFILQTAGRKQSKRTSYQLTLASIHREQNSTTESLTVELLDCRPEPKALECGDLSPPWISGACSRSGPQDQDAHDPIAHIESWSIDPAYDGQIFRPQWRSHRGYRSRKGKTLRVTTTAELKDLPLTPAHRIICIRSLDIFGSEAETIIKLP